ncbi:MAG: phosphatidate cytidylyltransferase [Prevotellaceae bacterium]|nr:phosphatidate cytidylyltransferase [Prevotellaceae bacterium]
MNNFITRTVSGTIFLGILLAALIFHPVGFGAAFLLIMTVGLCELYAMTLPDRRALPAKIIGCLTAISLFLLIFLNNMLLIDRRWFALLIVPLMALFVVELYLSAQKPFDNIARALGGIIYVALPFSLFSELVFVEGNYRYGILLTLFVMLWCNDVGAYCFGMLFGRGGKHKLFERISPKKSWEGFAGGAVFLMAATFVIRIYSPEWLPVPAVHACALAAIVTVMATFGDLVESMFKRSAGIKDSGQIMPGHGGILDRFDGALLAFPCALAYLKIFNIEYF